MFLCIAPYLFEEVFYGSVTISPIQPASDGNQNLQLFNGNDPWPVFQLHVRSSFWDDAVFSSTSKYLSNLWSLHEDFYGNQKKQGFLLRDLHSVETILSHHHTENHVDFYLVGIFLSILRIKLEQKRQQPTNA